MNIPEISKAYFLLNELNNRLKSPCFNAEEIKTEIEFSDGELLKNIKEFNRLVEKLEEISTLEEKEQKQEILIELRIQSMDIATTFDNLADEISKLIKA